MTSKHSRQLLSPLARCRSTSTPGRLLVWLACLLLTGAVGCERQSADETEAEKDEAAGSSAPGAASSSDDDRPPSENDDASAGHIVYVDGDTPSPETVLARAGSHRVTLDEYRRYLRRTLLFAPREKGQRPEDLSPRQKASVKRQHQTLRSLLRQKVVREEADERGLEVDDGEREEFLRNHDKLARYAPILTGDAVDVDLPRGLDADDLRTIADYYLLEAKLRRALVPQPDDDELWELWQKRRDRIRLAYVVEENSPTPSEIDDFLAKDRKRDWKKIRAHYESHLDEYARPSMVELALVKPAPDQSPEESELRRAAEMLADGRAPGEVADEFGWRAEPDAWLVSRENPDAFDAETGTTGIEIDGSRGTYAWRVEGHRSDRERELDSGLRREIAADLLRQKIVPSVGNKMERVLKAMDEVGGETFPLEGEPREKLEERLAGFGADLETTDFFPRSTDGNIPGMGLAEEVARRASDLGADDPVVDEPVLSRGRVFAFRLLDRDGPSRSEFESRRDEFRSRIVERRRKRAIDRFFAGWLEDHQPEFNLRPLHVEYGRLEKK